MKTLGYSNEKVSTRSSSMISNSSREGLTSVFLRSGILDPGTDFLGGVRSHHSQLLVE